MIRVCHVQVLPLLSGAQRVMLDVFRVLDRNRYELHVACKEPGPLSDYLGHRGICCHFVPALDRPIRPYRDWQALRMLTELFGRMRFDIVHTHSSKPGIVGRLAARWARVPHVVHHVHGFAFHDQSPPWTRWTYGPLEQAAGLLADRVIFVNHEERLDAIAARILPDQKCLTVYNGVDLEAYSAGRKAARVAFRSACGLADDELAVVFVGRLEPQKQPLILAEVAAELERLLPSARWRLLVVGDGSCGESLRRRIQQLGVSRRCLLLGWRADTKDALHAADVILHPTLWEGLPLSLIEAHAAGVPSVASRVKGNREVVAPQTGFLCRPRDATSYAAALARLLADPELRADMGARARRRAARLFDGNCNYLRIAELYDELCGGRHDAAPRSLAA